MDRFSVIETLQKTDFTSVARVIRNRDDHPFVIKEMRQWILQRDSKDMVEKLCACNHPHVVQHFEWFEEPGYYFLVMEDMTGGDLRKILDSRENRLLLQEGEALLCFCPVVKALEFLHESGIVHRKIVPENVFLTPEGVVKLGDFGLGKTADIKFDKRVLNYGTSKYTAPELLDGSKGDRRSDVWAMGCLLYELLTLQHPFQCSSHREFVRNVTTGNYAPLPETISTQTKELVASMLKVNPDERITAKEIVDLQFLKTIFLYLKLSPTLNRRMLYESIMSQFHAQSC